MTADALAGDRLITMVLLRPGFEAEYEQRPPLYSIACLGKILADSKPKMAATNFAPRS